MNGVQSKTLSLRGAKRRGNPHPLVCDVGPGKRERIPTSGWRPPRNDRGEKNGTQSKTLSLRGAKRRGNPHPLCVRCGTGKKRTDSHVGANALLGMTEERRTVCSLNTFFAFCEAVSEKIFPQRRVKLIWKTCGKGICRFLPDLGCGKRSENSTKFSTREIQCFQGLPAVFHIFFFYYYGYYFFISYPILL